MEENKRGRPLKYKTVEELEKLINKYFKDCEEKEKPYTMSGLAVALDMDRKSLVNYSHREEFFPTIKRARDRVEQYLEENLTKGNAATGIIFNLKNNFGWKDKQEVDANVKGNISIEDYLKKVEGDEY